MMSKIIPFLSFFFLFTALRAQDVLAIKNIQISKNDTQLVISYDIDDNASNTFYEVNIKLFDSSSYAVIVPSVISGDIGEYIKPGKAKKIIIPFAANKLNPNTGYGVDFNPVHKNTISETNAVLRSALVPGWGDQYVFKNGKTQGILIATLSYGCIGYGIYSKIMAGKEYDQYQNSFDQSEMNTSYDNAISKNKQFIIFTSAGVGIWAFDVVRVALKSNKNKKMTSGLSYHTPLIQRLNYCILPPASQSNTPVLYLSFKF